MPPAGTPLGVSSAVVKLALKATGSIAKVIIYYC